MNSNLKFLNFSPDIKIHSIKNSVITFLLSFAFATDTLYTNTVNLSLSKVSFLILSITAVSNFYKVLQIEKIEIFISLAIFFICIVIFSTFFNSNIIFSKFALRWIAAFFVSLSISALLQGYGISSNLRYKIMINSCIAAGIIFIAYTLTLENYLPSLIDFTFYNKKISPRASSLASGPNILGMFGSLLASMIYVKKIKNVNLFNLILIISSVIIFISGSKFNALIFLFILASTFFIYKDFLLSSLRIFLLFIISFLFLIHHQLYRLFFLGNKFDSYNDRVTIFNKIYDNAMDSNDKFIHYMFGWGPDDAEKIISYGQAHNWIFDFFYRVGFLGLLSFIFIITFFYLVQKGKKINYSLPLSILLISNLMSGSFGSSSISYLIIIFAFSFNFKTISRKI